MIPPEKSATVLQGLHAAFGTAIVEDIRAMPKGLSSDLVFRIVVDGSPYLLRIMTRIDESMDPVRIFACMSAAADAGLAPTVRYLSAEDGIAITDFVEVVPLSLSQALLQLPHTLRKLHALPPFPKAFNYVMAHNGFIWRFRKAGLLPQREIEEIFARYEQVCAMYPRLDTDIVSCHNDLKPENILFDGHRLWLMGWQAALLNDRYFDLAIPANFILNSEADESTYLDQYFGRPPDEYERAKFYLMRQVMHIFSATVYLLLGSAGKPLNQSPNLPSFRDFHRSLWAGEIDLADNDMKIVYSMIHWQQLLQNVREARLDEALRIVSDRHPNSKGMSRLLPDAP